MAGEKMLDDLRGRHREKVLRAAATHGAKSIAVFGSVARGEAGPESDVDFLVEFEPGRSLLDLLHLSDDLEELLGCSVDVVSVGGLKSRDVRIREEAIAL